jgi:pimeloyl-ACP methyl ester carboxylesterase
MRISVEAPVLQPYVRPLAQAEPATPPLPTHIDLTRKLVFESNRSEVDEACVVLVEMSVLVYRSLSEIREVLQRLPFDQAVAIDKGRRRDSDWRWLDAQAAKAEATASLTLPGNLRLGSLQLGLSPELRKLVQDALAKQPVLSVPVLAPLPGPSRPAKVPPVQAVAEFAQRAQPPRVLALLRGNSALIAFRGTSGLKDWFTDLSFWPAWSLPLRHQGFEWTWQGVKPQVEAWLKEVTARLGQPPTIYLTGHSLGGAVATLAAVDLSERYPIARVVTLGSPRVGSWGFRKRYARSQAAPDANGGARFLPQVTTRWVHGNDLFATFVPPPGFTAHVVSPEYLKPADSIDVKKYLPENAMDVMPIANLVSRMTGTKTASPWPSSPWQPPTSWLDDARPAAGQFALWLSMTLPGAWWSRLLMPFMPLITESMVRSGFRHKSGRYLGFMPPTALFRAMFYR